jgi:hypothetical protein
MTYLPSVRVVALLHQGSGLEFVAAIVSRFPRFAGLNKIRPI